MRALAMIYLIAFVSLWVQVQGLVGANGILPAQATMDSLRHVIDEATKPQAKFQAKPELKSGWSRYHRSRSLFVSALVDLPFSLHDLSRVPRVSMGHSFARNRAPGHLPRSLALAPAASVARNTALTPRVVAATLAAVQTHVPIRRRQADQRRPHLAQREGS